MARRCKAWQGKIRYGKERHEISGQFKERKCKERIDMERHGKEREDMTRLGNILNACM